MDDISATEFLASMPEVDAQRIGCTGWSMGGYRAWMLSALSDRVKVGAAVCWMVTSDEQMKLSSHHIQNGGFANWALLVLSSTLIYIVYVQGLNPFCQTAFTPSQKL